MYQATSQETVAARLAAARKAGPEAVAAYMSLRLARHAAVRGASHAEYLLADGFTAAEIVRHQRLAREMAPVIVRDLRGISTLPKAFARGLIDSINHLMQAMREADDIIRRTERTLAEYEVRRQPRQKSGEGTS